MEAAVNRDDIRVVAGSNISRETILTIIHARGRDADDIWTLDRQRDGTIRIQKTRKDSRVYPPGAAVEFWHQDDQGKWKPRFTA
jgi:hypothetical protein